MANVCESPGRKLTAFYERAFAEKAEVPRRTIKTKTLAQVEAMKAKAVRFVDNVLDDPDRASEIEDESVESYAARKKIRIANRSRRFGAMATKAEIENVLDEVQGVLETAYTPEASREELAQAIGEALDLLEGGEDDDDHQEAEDDAEGEE